MAPTITDALRDTLLTELETARVPPLPHFLLYPWEWPKCFHPALMQNARLAALVAQDRQHYYDIGVAVLPQAVFLMIVDDLADKPSGYATAVQAAVQSQVVLERLVAKIDERLVANIPTGRIHSGFLSLVGILWLHESRNTEKVTKILRPFFAPLLRVAGEAYLVFEATKDVKRVNPSKAERQRDKKLAELQFVTNVCLVQRTPAPPMPNPNPPAWDSPRATGFLTRDDSPISGALSPSTFRPRHSPAADHKDILHVDLHDMLAALDPVPVPEAGITPPAPARCRRSFGPLLLSDINPSSVLDTPEAFKV
ncbi:hypothetical protein B0H16DRAFT_1900623 [Mycena metata]|uniref:Uncharacterized protein n=1 Tax=Mycena metata TaxID=1033252 RepID=A0AAD7MDM5_9AGAR|nr:hypothetical protein B0H16DRAFT_1901903 [Mycena metata]KAJ7711436.1 hypothetical protein B0H16DRAFT_1900623 [Mycena metata]